MGNDPKFHSPGSLQTPRTLNCSHSNDKYINKQLLFFKEKIIFNRDGQSAFSELGLKTARGENVLRSITEMGSVCKT